MTQTVPFDLRFDRIDMIVERMLHLCEKDSWKQGFIKGAVFQIKNEFAKIKESGELVQPGETGWIVRLAEVYYRLGLNESEKLVDFV